MATDFQTVGQVARERKVPEWLVRRIVDAIDPNLPRFGMKRVITRRMLPKIDAELRRKGAIGSTEAAPC